MMSHDVAVCVIKCGSTGIVEHQVFHCDCGFAVGCELGSKKERMADGHVKLQKKLLVKDHGGCGGGQDLQE